MLDDDTAQMLRALWGLYDPLPELPVLARGGPADGRHLRNMAAPGPATQRVRVQINGRRGLFSNRMPMPVYAWYRFDRLDDVTHQWIYEHIPGARDEDGLV